MGDATATPSDSKNHAKTHQRRDNKALGEFMAGSLDALRMNFLT